MRALLVGEVVELEAKPWEFNGGKGVALSAYLRTGSLRDGATRVRVNEAQYHALSVGDQVTAPVDIFAQVNDYGPPKLRVALGEDYVPVAGGNQTLSSYDSTELTV
jgi:hypothetical protein